MSKHQGLYKCSTPPWKDRYKKRCFQRLKQSRDKFMQRFRCPSSEEEASKIGDTGPNIRDLMQDEWSQFQRDNPGLDQMGEVDSVLHVFGEIQKELMEEEQAILRQYDESRLFDEQSLTATINAHLTDSVICPVCQRNPLLLNKGIVFCQCGLRIDTEQDCLTLTNIGQHLTRGVEGHAAACPAPPAFGVVNQVGMDNLLLTCKTCDFMFVVI